MFRGSGGSSAADRRESMEDPLASLAKQQQEQQDDTGNLSDDDNAAPDMQSEAEMEVEKEDPLLLAIDDLEGRVVAALDDLKLHPGIQSSTLPGSPTVYEELATILRPVVEVAAHTAPSVARTYYQGVGVEGVEASCEDVYQRIVSDLVLPVLLETAQSDTSPAKRGAALESFRAIWKECQKAGSWLDATTNGLNAGPYGSGLTSHSSSNASTPARHQQRRRQVKKLQREGEILRYWVQASIACTLPGAFTSDVSEGAVAARGVIAASASIRPSLKHIAQRIRDADDRGANRVFAPVMKMVEGVLKKLFLSTTDDASASGDALRSSCIKFLEIVCLCCSSKPQDSHKRRGNSTDDFALDDLPVGHPIITREALESIGEYSFSTIRGLALMGGQVKIDVNLLSDMMLTTGDDGSPSAQVVSILKPAALAFLELESSFPQYNSNDDNSLKFSLNTGTLEFDFILSQKSNALAINAVSALAMNRPVFFKEGALCLARRVANPPVFNTSGGPSLTRAGILSVINQAKASCLTLLRNALSVTTNSWEILHEVLKACDMEIQADKALAMARQTTALKTAGRAARNRANMFYEWDTSEADKRSSKRQRETDDALAKMRAAKAARGLGHGIQLPTSMVDSIELILTNLKHLPSKRPQSSSSSSKAAASSSSSSSSSSKTSKHKTAVTLDFVVDAIMTNGASLAQEEGRWYGRDGGSAWTVKLNGSHNYEINAKLLEVASLPQSDQESTDAKQQQKQSDSTASSSSSTMTTKDKKAIFHNQCNIAAGEAVGRIVTNGITSRHGDLADFANKIAARLAWSLKNVEPPAPLQPAHEMAMESIEMANKRLSSSMNDTNNNNNNNNNSDARTDKDTDPAKQQQQKQQQRRNELLQTFPLVTSCLAMASTPSATFGAENIKPKQSSSSDDTYCSLSNCILNEAYLQSCNDVNDDSVNNAQGSLWKYDTSLEIFVGSAVHASDRANDKPNDNDRKNAATHVVSNLQRELGILPSLTPSSLILVSAMCDIEEITKKATDAARKTSQQNITVAASLSTAKQSAEKRATAALLTLRDAAFQRSDPTSRKSAVDCAIGIAAGRYPASSSCEDKALKLVMNVLFPRSETLAKDTIESAITELERAAAFAIENYDKVHEAKNKQLAKEQESSPESRRQPDQLPDTDEERQVLDKVKKPALLLMALCIRRPEIIKTLFELSSQDKADVLSKAVRQNMSKLARAGGAKHGADKIALKVTDMDLSIAEMPLVLAFLDNLAPTGEKNLPTQEFIDACHKIHETKLDDKGKPDPRFLIPVVSALFRSELESKLSEFIAADDKIFLAALSKMGERVGRHALIFREEPDPETPTLRGMTFCEQLVFLHQLDFVAAGLPQKRYLDAIRLCLDSDDIFNDRLVMSALDHMSGTFLANDVKLPLAYMRTIILVCSKHESLHSWICHILLPRLVEGKIYTDKRQWEGWMRCAKMLENTGDSSVSSREAIRKLPKEQLEIYQSRYGAIL